MDIIVVKAQQSSCLEELTRRSWAGQSVRFPGGVGRKVGSHCPCVTDKRLKDLVPAFESREARWSGGKAVCPQAFVNIGPSNNLEKILRERF